jgi:glycosyltransferase involved in cell wall biosynthesis
VDAAHIHATIERLQHSVIHRMIRVAFINHHGGVPAGGERSLEAYLCRVPNDIDPHVFLFEEGAYAQRVRDLNIPVYVVPASPRLMSVSRADIRPSYAWDGIRQALRLRKLLKSVDVDVVVTNSMKAHIVGAIAARLCGIPVVTWLKELPEGFALTLIRAVSRICATERIGCSRAVIRQLGLPRSTALVPPLDLATYGPAPPAETAKATLGLPPEKLIFSIVGRIARIKGQDRFLRAAACVCASRISNVHFAIVGSPTFPQDHAFVPELAELTAQLGIAERVSFIPWLEDPRVAYAASDLICNASSAEGFGRTSVEAALYGVPVLCFDDGGAGEAVLPAVTGTVVPAGDIEAFAAAMVAYASDPVALRRAGAAARVYAQRHDADQLATPFFEIIRRAASKRDWPKIASPSHVAIAETSVPVVVERT